jgi:hypothetical protein
MTRLSPEERREAQLDGLCTTDYGADTVTAAFVRATYARLMDAWLAYFDEHEPAVADAIRYGLDEVGWAEARLDDLRIDYPEGHPKQ